MIDIDMWYGDNYKEADRIDVTLGFQSHTDFELTEIIEKLYELEKKME